MNTLIRTKFPLKIIQIALGLIFLGSSFYKILSPPSFAHAIYNYQLAPLWLINPAAIILPWVQFLCGFALLTRIGEKGASLLILLMMISFQIALGSALIRGLNVSCGCFEAGGSPATWLTFSRDTLILLLAAIQFTVIARRPKADEAI